MSIKEVCSSNMKSIFEVFEFIHGSGPKMSAWHVIDPDVVWHSITTWKYVHIVCLGCSMTSHLYYHILLSALIYDMLNRAVWFYFHKGNISFIFIYFFSKWQGAVSWMGWLTESHSVPGSIIELNTFLLGLVGALPHVQSHCGVLYKLNWSQMIIKRSIKTFSYGFWGFIFFFCMLSRL